MKCYLIQYIRGRYIRHFLFSLFINKLDGEIKVTLTKFEVKIRRQDERNNTKICCNLKVSYKILHFERSSQLNKQGTTA